MKFRNVMLCVLGNRFFHLTNIRRLLKIGNGYCKAKCQQIATRQTEFCFVSVLDLLDSRKSAVVLNQMSVFADVVLLYFVV